VGGSRGRTFPWLGTLDPGRFDGITWSSSAEFQATSAGTVSLDQPSLGGSYTGVNPMGLFTRMTPPPGSTAAAFLHGPAGYDVELEASVSGRVAATTMAKRQGPTAVGVTEKQLRPTKGRIYGNLYLPRHITGRRPAVLVSSGSAGGLTTTMAAACWPPTAIRAWPWPTSRHRACPRP
jgi:hypothetical protein